MRQGHSFIIGVQWIRMLNDTVRSARSRYPRCTQTQWLGTVGCPGIVRVGLGILKYSRVFIRILGQVSPVLLGLSKDRHGCGGSCLCNLDIQS